MYVIFPWNVGYVDFYFDIFQFFIIAKPRKVYVLKQIFKQVFVVPCNIGYVAFNLTYLNFAM
jgi:hypothetical protein